MSDQEKTELAARIISRNIGCRYSKMLPRGGLCGYERCFCKETAQSIVEVIDTINSQVVHNICQQKTTAKYLM